MFDDEFINQIFENRYEKIENNIQAEYHKKIKGKKNVSADNFEIILFPKISPEN